MSAPSKVFLLHGFLGVGKTTLARRLEAEHHAIRFTHDEWMSQLYGTDPPADAFPDYAKRVSALIEQTWTRCTRVGVPVVLDFGFWSRSERARVRALATALGAEPVLLHVHCPAEIAKQRIAKRNEAQDGSLHISVNTYRLLWQRYEPLGADEQNEDHPT